MTANKRLNGSDPSLSISECNDSYKVLASSDFKFHQRNIGTNIVKAFHPSMLEPWHPSISNSNRFKKMMTFSSSSKKCQPKEEMQTFFNDTISALQQLYSSGQQLLEISENKSCSHSSNANSARKDFTTWEEIDGFISLEYEKCLENDLNQMDIMKKCARNIVTLVTSFITQHEKNYDLCTIQFKMRDKVFTTPSTVCSKDVTSLQKGNECVFQILLRFEWFLFSVDHFIEEKNKTEWPIYDITQFLRTLSLSHDVGRMKDFLCHVLTDFYTEKFGDLLVEIHNDLMIPLPQSLRDFSLEKEAEESFFEGSVRSDLPSSAGPFSLLSSDESRDSVDFRPTKKQFLFQDAQQMKPTVNRQIKVPNHSGSIRVDPMRRSGSNEALKHLFNNTHDEPTKKMPRQKSMGNNSFCSPTRRSQLKSASQDVVRVRRDLFTSPGKRRRKARSLSNHPKSPDQATGKRNVRRHRSVLDTPEAKQRMTALARQRLRMRRSWTSQEEKLDDTLVVEESPLKQVENHNHAPFIKIESKLKRSPRHSIMLTRRHSFYKDGSYENCRTVTRAKIVHQHKEAVPPTPRIDPACLSSAEKSVLFSPKSLLFSNVSSKQASSANDKPTPGARTRRRLRLNSESKSESRLSVLCSKKNDKTMPSSSGTNSTSQDSTNKTPKKRVSFSTISPNKNSSVFDDEIPFQAYLSDAAT